MQCQQEKVNGDLRTCCYKGFVFCLKKEFEDENLLESDRDITISIEEVKAEKPKSSADFPPADDDPLSSDNKTEVWTETYGFLWSDKLCLINKLYHV